VPKTVRRSSQLASLAGTMQSAGVIDLPILLGRGHRDTVPVRTTHQEVLVARPPT